MARERLQRDQRREKILEAALAAFADGGPGTTTAAVARAAGVSEGLLYHY